MDPEQNKITEHLVFNLPYGIVLISSKNRRIQYCNYHRVLDLHIRSVEQKEFFEVFPDFDTPDFNSILETVLHEKSPYTVTGFERHVGRETAAVFLDVTLTPVTNNPAEESLLITFTDVTGHILRKENQIPGTDRNLSSILKKEIATIQAFRQREEIFRLLIENSRDGIAILTKKGEVVYVSPAVQSIMGYSEDEAIELNVLSLISAEDATRHKKLFEVFFTKRSITNEIRIRHKKGHYIWVEFSITNFLDTAGINAIVINFRDITERKQSEELISANERMLRDLADAMPQLVWMADPDGTVTYYNNRIREYAGARKSNNTWEWAPLLHEDDIEQTTKAWNTAVSAKSIYYAEHRVKMRDGSLRYHLSRAYPQFNKDGDVIKWFGTATDIHAQKEAQAFLEKYAGELEQKVNERTAELQKQKDFAETILDSSIDEIAVYDTGTRLINANRKFFDKFQLQKDEVIGKKLLDIFPQAVEGQKRLLLALNGESLFFPAYYSPVAKAYYESFIIPLKDAAGATYAILVIVHDVTENIRNEELLRISADKLKEANDSLLRKNQELEQFAYIASHDMQEPLRKISTFANLLEKNRDNPETYSRYTSKIVESAGRMSKLISDVLQYSQVDKKADIVQVDLNDVFRYVLTDLDLLIEQKAAVINLSPLPAIEGVNRQLTQVFYNLMSNALKFTKAGSHVEINVTCKNVAHPEQFHLKEGVPYYQITISDNGIGFSQEYADRIFQMFHRLNAREQYSGSGIGLAMVRKIVTKHNGVIWAESEEEKGATFHVVLPAVQGDAS